MTWEPTTRGTSPNNPICDEMNCKEHNTAFEKYSKDRDSVRYLCQKHWNAVLFLFTSVASCKKCVRNYVAETSAQDRQFKSVKVSDKWWDLCDRHFEFYERMFFMGFTLPKI